jgi:multiple sugar transport system permease protein
MVITMTSQTSSAISDTAPAAKRVFGARQRVGWQTARARFFIAMLAPSVILLTLITILPILFLIGTSFTSWEMSRPDSLKFIGLANYVRLVTDDPRLLNSLWVQVRYTLMTVPFQVVVGLTLALYLKSRIRNQWLMEATRSIFIIPMVIPPVVAALIWRILFTPPVSILSYTVTALGGQPLTWLADPQLALVALAVANVWEFFPFCFLLLYAGLQSLPTEPVEAAQVDGASGWQTLRYVTLPMLRPTLSIVILFQIVDSIRTFPLVFVMTDGGPGFATEPTNYYAYQQAFNYTYIGYSSAMILLVFAFTVLLTLFILRNIQWSRGD